MAKTVFITGCSTGVGLKSAVEFANQGWNVVATMRKPEAAAEELKNADKSILLLRLDLEDSESIKIAVSAAIEKFGSIDLLLNNAGYGQYGLVEAVSREKVVQSLNVNVVGVTEVLKAVLPHMRRNEIKDGSRGMVINVSSGAGAYAFPLIGVYSASKHALDGLTKALYFELHSQQIETKLIVPHSAIDNTAFNVTSFSRFEENKDLSSYQTFVGGVFQKFEGLLGAVTLTSDKVAKFIYDAATDGKRQFKYLIGEDPLEVMHKYETMPEEEFMQWTEKTFTPTS